MSEIKITDANFEKEVINSDVPVLVDFWAEWCGPCKMLSPIISDIAEEYAGRVKVGKVNVDENPRLSMEFHVVSIPTVMLFKNGRAEATLVGYRPKEEFTALLG